MTTNETFKNPLNSLAVLAAVLVAIYALLVVMGFGPYLTDQYGFRQTQTAITARYFSDFADFLSYETPVLGPPWSIPFEFPLYQALAKGTHIVSGMTLETSGRLVSVAFFLACFWPLHHLLRDAGVANTPLVMATVLLTPLYVFWSRSFMIETAALFFSLSYLAAFSSIYLRRELRLRIFLLLTTSGALAALVKITTVLPLLLITSMFAAWILVGVARRRTSVAVCAGLVISHAIILLIALAWIQHSDAVKSMNPLGAGLTSSAIRSWNLGTLAQRLDPAIWLSLVGRTVDMFFPLPSWNSSIRSALAVLWATIFLYLFFRCSRIRKLQIFALCGLFLLPFVLFLNLHYVHSYYQVANGIYLCLAFGLAVLGAVETSTSQRDSRLIGAIYVCFLAAIAACSALSFHYQSSFQPRQVDLANAVERLSSPNSVIIVTGMDWSPELPYQASRRALMLAEWMVPTPIRLNEIMQGARAAGTMISTYVACGKDTWLGLEVRKELGLLGKVPVADLEGCAIYVIE